MEILGICVVMLIGVIYGYYTVSGSGIAEHPYHNARWRPGRLHTGQRVRPGREHHDQELVARRR